MIYRSLSRMEVKHANRAVFAVDVLAEYVFDSMGLKQMEGKTLGRGKVLMTYIAW